MRYAGLALVALVALAGSAPARPVRDWSATVTATPAGTLLVGNPAARVQLVEYVSYTCPHCAHFAAESAAPLKAMVRTGTVSVETRNLVRDSLDLAAVLAVRCASGQRALAAGEELFARQADWMARGAAYVEANRAELQPLPLPEQVRRLARGAGIDTLVARHGVSAAALDGCLADPALFNSVVAVTRAAGARVEGTPSFEINGTLVDAHDWAGLSPLLRTGRPR